MTGRQVGDTRAQFFAALGLDHGQGAQAVESLGEGQGEGFRHVLDHHHRRNLRRQTG